MKTNAVLVGTVLVLFVSACAPQAAPTSVSQGVQNTAVMATVTETVQTMEAISTATIIPPTATATSLPLPTDTPLPNPTSDSGAATATGALLPTISATSIPQQSSESPGDACNKLLTSWKGPTAHFSIYNETKPEGRIVLSLYVVTPQGECGSLADLSAGPAGSYSARAYVDGKKNFIVYGDFQIKEGTWKIVVRNDKIIALGSCYPSC